MNFHAWVEANRPKGRVLDVGCGHHLHGDVGIDIRKAAASVIGGGTHLPFRDASFDGAVCAQVLSYTDDDPIAIQREIFRVMKPGGVAFYTFPRWRSWPLFKPATLGARKVGSVRGMVSYVGYRVTK